jgi:hypothetical protein
MSYHLKPVTVGPVTFGPVVNFAPGIWEYRLDYTDGMHPRYIGQFATFSKPTPDRSFGASSTRPC